MFIEAIFEALTALLTVNHMFFLATGVLLGIIVGILPGLGGIVGFSILLPFLYGMDTTSALAMLVGMVAVVPTSDTFTSVLMGIPGSTASQATVLDGYALSKKGQAARALSAAFAASLIGGLLGAIILTMVILFAKPLILSLASAELFMLGVLGLSMVGVLSGDNLYKGFIACCIGLLIGSIGAAPATGEWRITFGSFYLFDGVKLIIVALGMFAIPEIVDLLVKNRRISSKEVLGTGWKQGLKDVWMYKFIVARCAPVGAMIGAIPGLGGSVVDWIAYGHVVQTAKDKSQFGKGDIRGVIAPESANNAKEGGGLVPTLLFGIPGSGSMAVFLGGLAILGIESGPNLVGEQLDISYIIIWSLALANVIGAGFCLLISGHVARLTTIPYGYVAPFMIMVVCFASFQATRSLEDLLLLIVVGAIGVLLKYFSWSRPAVLIGFVLASTIETYLYQAVQFYDWGFVERPGVIIIGLIIMVSLLMGNVLNRKKNKIVRSIDKMEALSLSEHNIQPVDFPEANSDMTPDTIANRLLGKGVIFSAELCFVLAIIGFAIYAVIDIIALEILGKIFPLSVIGVMVLASIPLIYSMIHPKTHDRVVQRKLFVRQRMDEEWKLSWLNFLWFIVLCVATWLSGFIAALTLLFVALIRVKTSASWLRTGLITATAIGFLLFVAHVMTLHLPEGIIIEYFF